MYHNVSHPSVAVTPAEGIAASAADRACTDTIVAECRTAECTTATCCRTVVLTTANA